MQLDEGSARWQQVKALLDEALDRPPEERGAFLEKACRGRPDLRAEVEELLEAEAQAPAYLEEGIAAFFPALAREEALPGSEGAVGQRVGPYRLVEPIGQGGMGAVYRAERVDGHFEQEVAIKLLRGFETEQLRERFQQERQILASLEHPGIARLYDGGLTEDGHPYFVMEYVEGQSIGRYCDDRRLSVEERIRLFRDVTAAVHYAHQNLVVHRDLKPSNVLVTESGQVKLLDFGIAKLLAAEAEIDPRTRTGERWMTPEYASPEQVRGETVTTASDIYQLGILLYELLSGQRPYELAECTPSEAEHLICEEMPTAPSMLTQRLSAGEAEAISRARGTRPERLQRALRGDLDTIVMKALRKEPERRYASAEQFSEDLRRYFEGLPVEARPDTFAYRARKFVRRHRWGLGTAALVVLLLLGYAVTLTLQARQIAHERDRAEAAKSFLVELFEGADPEKQGSPVMVRDVLDEGAERIEEQMADQPAMQAELMDVIGSAYRGLGHNERALELYREALALREHLFDAESREVADTKNNIGEALYYQGRYDEAESYFRDALEVRRKLLGSRHEDIAQSLNNLAVADLMRDDHASAEPKVREALDIFREQLGEDHWRVANATNNLAFTLRMQGKVEEAEHFYRQALDLYRRINGEEHRGVAIAYNNIGAVLLLQGEYEAAEQAHREALRLMRKVLDEESPFPGAALLGIGRAQHARGELAAAESTYHEALDHHRRVYSDEHFRRVSPMIELGILWTETGRAERAEPMLRESLEHVQETLSPGHWKVADTRSALGYCLTALGQYDEAEALLLQAHEIFRERSAREDRYLRKTRERLVGLYEAWDKPEKAAPYRASLETAVQEAPRSE